jgi:Zn-dependent peptidase ImmA (M78 family)
MHEAGHVALWHPNQLHACLVEGQEAYDQLESDATAFAAAILIPRLTFVRERIYGKATLEKLAERFVVPTELMCSGRELL